MSDQGFPPSHWDVDKPQPEICQVCGSLVEGELLEVATVDGIRGLRVCNTTRSCRMRHSTSWRERFREQPERSSTIGNSRVYPPGAETWAKDP